jgi:hypothetical protein
LRQSNVTAKHDIAQPSIVKSVALATTVFNGRQTACVRVAFADELVSVNSRDFKLAVWLAVGNSRERAGEITLQGSFSNEEVSVSTGDTFISISGGKVLVAEATISNLEIDLGGAQIFTKVTNGKRYYASAREGLTDADERMSAAHPEIENAVRLETVNLVTTGKCVSLRDYGAYHVYSGSGEYLGTTDGLVAFSKLYDLASARINAADLPDQADGPTNKKPSPFGDTPKEKAAKADMDTAAQAAAASGSDSANVRVRDVESISAAELQAMFEASSAKGLKAKYTADTTDFSRNVIQGRSEINPALAVKLGKDVLLGVRTDSVATQRALATFEKYYRNPIRVVSLAHEGSFGMTVKISAKFNMDGINLGNLRLYAYDGENDSVKPIASPKSYIDSNGYLHFTTIYGGDIVISDGPLNRR